MPPASWRSTMPGPAPRSGTTRWASSSSPSCDATRTEPVATRRSLRGVALMASVGVVGGEPAEQRAPDRAAEHDRDRHDDDHHHGAEHGKTLPDRSLTSATRQPSMARAARVSCPLRRHDMNDVKWERYG